MREVDLFLTITGALFLVVYAVPLLFVPLRFARMFRWALPAEPHLAIYFGRSLGAVAVGVTVMCLRTPLEPGAQRLVLELIMVAGALLTLVHLWGAFRRVQPWPETLETVLYAGFTVAAVLLRARLG